MDHNTQKFIQQLRSISLSDSERVALRSAIIERVRAGGARQRETALWWTRFVYARRVQASFLSCVIVLGYGSAVTLAAENALPGDTLYPVKTLVTEPLKRLVTANNPAAQASFEASLLNERLQEAETLDKEMKLASDTPLQQTVREEIRKQSVKAEAVSVDDNRGSGAERTLKEVRDEHKHILEKLDLAGGDGENVGEKGDNKKKEERKNDAI